ncbi:MAG: asparagine synthetase B, partial [Sphingobacteriaceae bacterium]
MCRIAGVLSSNLNIRETEHQVRVMCDVMQHGGPDDEGFFADEQANIVFGHRRLSIIDLSKSGHQPMADIDKRTRITFNGEIYNYRELKTQLVASGVNFHSNTDTEVILMAYLQWGVAAFQKFRGMFAFALYDATKKITYLVRDTAGIKPLYYHVSNNKLTFASEVKALKRADITDEDETWRVRFLAFGHIPEPYTTLKHVYSLPKGHYLQWEHGSNTYKIHSYSYSKDVGYVTSPTEAAVKVYDAISKSIERQLIADAPIGVFLSGGIDSSIIT